MKRIALLLLAAAGLTAVNARADRVEIHGSVNVGGPAYGRPGYYAPPAPHYAPPARGYWREVRVPVWVPGAWVVTRDSWGRHVRVWAPGHHEYRLERVWVDGHSHGGPQHYSRGYGPRWNG